MGILNSYNCTILVASSEMELSQGTHPGKPEHQYSFNRLLNVVCLMLHFLTVMDCSKFKTEKDK